MSRHDRPTVPTGLLPAARESARELPAAAESDVWPSVPLGAVPWLVVTYDELRRLPLDARTGFVVSLIDGKSTVRDISGMREDEVLGILGDLARLGAIELRDPR